MEKMVTVALFENAVLLLALSVAYEITYLLPYKRFRIKSLLNGLLISLVCFAIMGVSFPLNETVIFDTRTILISVTGLIFGTITTTIVAVSAIVFRIVTMPGIGVLPGVSSIVTSALTGLLWRHCIFKKYIKWNWLSIYIMSIVTHTIMILGMFLLPYPMSIEVIKIIALPIMIIYPTVTVLLSLTLIKRMELRENQEARQQSEERFRSISESISDVFWTMDLNLKTNFVSSSIKQLTGETQEEHLSKSMEEKFSKKSLEKLNKIIKEEFDLENDPECDKKRTRMFDIEHYCADGSTVWLSMKASFVRDGQGKVVGIQGISRDITDIKRSHDEISYLNEHDVLTGLYNRRTYEKELLHLNRKEHLPLSVILVDINGLKLINDALGNDKGDEIIVQTSKLLKEIIRKGDFLARIGGDEFCILLPKTDIKTAREFFKLIDSECEKYNSQKNNTYSHINISYGAATKENKEDDFKEIYKEAEDNMRRRKLLASKSSRNAVISSIKATMQEKSCETIEHEQRMSLLARKIGAYLNLSEIEIESLDLLSKLHDIGKVGIPEQILRKPGELTDKEWDEMRKHPEIGYRIAMSSADIAPVAEYVLSHHERWDGLGYPRNLQGKNIPLLSRILSVVDAYDAMTEGRIYSKKMSKEEALQEIKRCSGTQFDPEIAESFIKIMTEEE